MLSREAPVRVRRVGGQRNRRRAHLEREPGCGELEFAEELAALPLVAAAFDAGRTDYGKARVFTAIRGPAELTPEQVEVLCATYLLAAPGSPRQLRHRLTRALLAIDPKVAARRYRRAVTTRRVVGYLSAGGTAVISVSSLPAKQAAACVRRRRTRPAAAPRGPPGTVIGSARRHSFWKHPPPEDPEDPAPF